MMPNNFSTSVHVQVCVTISLIILWTHKGMEQHGIVEGSVCYTHYGPLFHTLHVSQVNIKYKPKFTFIFFIALQYIKCASNYIKIFLSYKCIRLTCLSKCWMNATTSSFGTNRCSPMSRWFAWGKQGMDK